MKIPKSLSPAAQAVLTAVQATLPDYMLTDRTAGCFAAATIKAVADQVVPREPAKDSLWTSDAYRQRADTRAYLLAIAAELEAQP